MRALTFILSFLAGYAFQQHDAALKMREVIDVMADYDVRHVEVPFTADYYGMTVPDQRTIFFVNQMDLAQRRRVAIHEVEHVVLRLRGDERYADEEVIRTLTDIEYKKTYGDNQ